MWVSTPLGDRNQFIQCESNSVNISLQDHGDQDNLDVGQNLNFSLDDNAEEQIKAYYKNLQKQLVQPIKKFLVQHSNAMSNFITQSRRQMNKQAEVTNIVREEIKELRVVCRDLSERMNNAQPIVMQHLINEHPAPSSELYDRIVPVNNIDSNQSQTLVSSNFSQNIQNDVLKKNFSDTYTFYGRESNPLNYLSELDKALGVS